MWKTLAALALAVTGAGLPWERSIFSPMHDAPNELFGTKKTPEKTTNKPKTQTQTNKNSGWEPLARHSRVGAGSCAATSWWLRGWPQPVAGGLCPLCMRIGTSFTDSLQKSLFEFSIYAFCKCKYFSKKKKISNGGKTFVKRLDFSWFHSAPFPPLSASPSSSYRPTASRIRSFPVYTAPTPWQSSLGLR